MTNLYVICYTPRKLMLAPEARRFEEDFVLLDVGEPGDVDRPYVIDRPKGIDITLIRRNCRIIVAYSDKKK